MVAKSKPKASGKSTRHTLVSPEFVGNYVHLDKPYSGDDDIEPCYSIMLVLDPDNEEHAEFIDKLEAEIEDLVEAKWGEMPRKFKTPLKEGEDIMEDEDAFVGKIILNVRSTTRPGIIDADLQKILDVEEECYSGASFIVSISGYAWEHKVGGKGVSFGLDNVMKVADGDPLGGGRAKAEDDFAHLAPKRKKGSTTARNRGKVETADEDDDDTPATPRRRQRR